MKKNCIITIIINNNIIFIRFIYSCVILCFQCDLEHKLSVFAYDNASLVINTAHDVLFELRNASNLPVCSKLLSLKEHGVYLMNITRKQVCPSLVATNNPDQIYDREFSAIFLLSVGAFFLGKNWYDFSNYLNPSTDK